MPNNKGHLQKSRAKVQLDVRDDIVHHKVVSPYNYKNKSMTHTHIDRQTDSTAIDKAYKSWR